MARVRSTTEGAFDVDHVRSYRVRSSCAGAWTTSSSEHTYTGEQSVKTITDVLTPRFTSLRRCGKFLPLNPVDIITTTTTRTEGSGDVYANYVSGCYRQLYTGPKWLYVTPRLVVPDLDDAIMDAVTTAAVANAKSAVFDSLTFMGEFDQVVDMFKVNYERITTAGEYAAKRAKVVASKRYWTETPRLGRRRRPRNKKDLLRLFANFWLEGVFGWAPFVSDMEDAVASFRKTADGTLSEGRAAQSVDISDTKVTHIVNAFSDMTLTEVLDGTRTYRGCAYGLRNFRGGVDPIVTAYELLPYSFVVDYFINVGAWLQAWSPFSGVALKGSCVSIRDSYTYRQDVDIAYFGSQSGSFTGASTFTTVDRYQRIPASAGSLPSWNPRLTPKRVTNLVALALAGRQRVMKRLFE